MTLREDTVTAIVDGWCAGRQPVWSAADVDAVRKRLIDISAAVTPHVVGDVPLTDDEMQQFFLQRARAAIDVWLIRAAAGLRRSLRLEPLVHAIDGTPALGLRSARIDDIDRIQGIGRERAVDIARALAMQPAINDIGDLDAAPGVGPVLLARLRNEAYLDRPATTLLSPTLQAFCALPTIDACLALFDKTDLELFHGDASRLVLDPPTGGSTAARFLRLLALVEEDARRRLSPLSGALGSEAARMLSRAVVCARYLAALSPTDGTIAINATYRDEMLALIAAAAQRIRLAVFVATATRLGDQKNGQGIGSQDIIEALEARAAAGVAVQVIVDRDRPDDPYHSVQINRRVIQRLQAAGVEVKQDQREVLLHSKLLISDADAMILGSHNLTTSSITGTHELSVRLDSPVLATAYAERFDVLWAALP